MHSDMSFFSLFWQASFIVQLVMMLLLLMSVLSWVLIFERKKLLSHNGGSAKRFEDKFWSGVDLNRLYQESSARKDRLMGMELIFHSGFKEFARLSSTIDSDAVMEGTYRAMRISLSREVDTMENNLSTLATIGSISPYIGLFGTVWGIMNSFIALGEVQQATLSMVAPGIAEALIATAMGLFAAIPAVIAYNRFTTVVGKLENSYVNFMEEFFNILNRQNAVKK